MNKPLSKSELAVEQLLPEINANHRECMKSGRESVKYAMQAGELLLKIKQCVKHGEFSSIIEKRCDFAIRTAQAYMKLSAGLPAILEKEGRELLVDATIGGCLKLIGKSKQSKPKAHDVRISPPPGDCELSADEATAEVGAASDSDEESYVFDSTATVSGGVTFNTEELTGDSTDAFGNETPDELRIAFELRAGFDAQLARIAAIKTWITQNQNHPGAAVLASAASRIRSDLKQAASELKFSRPHCVCVYCQNKLPKSANCNACKGLGWITQPVFDAAPEGMKRDAKRSA